MLTYIASDMIPFFLFILHSFVWRFPISVRFLLLDVHLNSHLIISFNIYIVFACSFAICPSFSWLYWLFKLFWYRVFVRDVCPHFLSWCNVFEYPSRFINNSITHSATFNRAFDYIASTKMFVELAIMFVNMMVSTKHISSFCILFILLEVTLDDQVAVELSTYRRDCVLTFWHLCQKNTTCYVNSFEICNITYCERE